MACYKEVHILAGISGSGKSTLARRIARSNADLTTILSTDVIRASLFPGKEYAPSQNAATFRRLFSLLKYCLLSTDPWHDVLVIDSLALRSSQRIFVYKLIRNYCPEACIELDIFIPDLRVSLYNNSERTKGRLPTEVILHQLKAFQYPFRDEEYLNRDAGEITEYRPTYHKGRG